MGVTIFPSTNDVGGGKVLSETNVAAMIRALTRQTDCVVDGLTVDRVDGELAVTVAAGVAIISGYVVQVPGTTVTLPASSTRYLYLVLTRDGLGSVTGAQVIVDESDTVPADGLALAKVRTSDTFVIIPTVDLRVFGWAVHRQGDTIAGPLTIRAGFEDDPGAYFLTFYRVAQTWGGEEFVSAQYNWQIDKDGDLHLRRLLPAGQPQMYVGHCALWHDDAFFMTPGDSYESAKLLSFAPTERMTTSSEFEIIKRFRVVRPGVYRVAAEMKANHPDGGMTLHAGGEEVSVQGMAWTHVSTASKALAVGEVLDVYVCRTGSATTGLVKNVELLGVPEEGCKVLQD